VTETVCAPPHVDVAIAEQIVHKDYVPNSDNQHHDIALLRLVRDVKYTQFISPICLPGSSLRDINLVGHRMTLAGKLRFMTHMLLGLISKSLIRLGKNRDCSKQPEKVL